MSAIALDPLIAEAKRRARRRKFLAAAVVLAVAVGVTTWAVFHTRGAATVSGSTGAVSSATAVRLRGIDEVGSSGGVTWAKNGRGLWLTANGGRVWRKVALPHGTGLIDEQSSSVQFADPRHGWLIVDELTGYPTDRSRLVFARTTDGGRTWQPTDLCHGRCGAGSMSFLDARHGFLLAYERGPKKTTIKQLLRTADGGRTWQRVAAVSLWGPITFLNSRVGFAFPAGNEAFGPYFGPPIGTLYRTTDGGRTWSRYDIAESNSPVEEPVSVVGHRVVVVQNGPSPRGGRNLVPGTIYVSADGRHWNSSPVPGRPTVASSFTAASPTVWAFGSSRGLQRSDIYTTRDAGRRWHKIALRSGPKGPALQQVKVNFVSSRLGWVVLGRRLYRTTDGGVHWAAAGPTAKLIPLRACSPAQLETRFWSSPGRLRRGRAVVQFVNTGRLGCRLSGWPTVVAVTAAGTRIVERPITPAWFKRPGRAVALGPGGSASAGVYSANPRPVNGVRSCPKVVSLRVTPPGARKAVTLAGPWGNGSGTFYFRPCGGITVSPVYP